MACISNPALPKDIDTVVIGNGPSALILSFILHGNIPYYDPTNAHPDPILHEKLSKFQCLLDIDVSDLTAHFAASRLSYSTQALPGNVLLDTLIRPLADTDPGKHQSCVTWRHEQERSVPHLVLGNTSKPGGQWADNAIAGSWDIGALSYAEMLSLPGYSLTEHRRKAHGCCAEDFDRPSRRDVAKYLAVYPKTVGISDCVYTNVEVRGISRNTTGFHIASHDVRCKHLVLASGTFSNLIPARPLLQPLLSLESTHYSSMPPMLVIGSGFTAADVILSAPPGQRILHIFKWAPDEHPSPLRACHPKAYPEYASVYRRMKLTVKNQCGSQEVLSPMKRKRSNPFERADWQDFYEGLPNTRITEIKLQDRSAKITLKASDGRCFEREISAMQYVIGRRGSLDFIDHDMLCEILGPEIASESNNISGKTLRAKVEESLQVAPEVFAIGSLTGDSLIRFAFGGCVLAAREIMRRAQLREKRMDTPATATKQSRWTDTRVDGMTSLDDKRSEYTYTNGHVGLGEEVTSRPISIDVEAKACELWHDSGWWSGSCTVS